MIGNWRWRHQATGLTVVGSSILSRVVGGLRPQPIPIGQTEKQAQPQIGVGGDCAIAAHDLPEFKKKYGPRGVLHCWADRKGGQKIENTGPLTKKRMETCDDEFLAGAKKFIQAAHDAGEPSGSTPRTCTPRTPSPRARAGPASGSPSSTT